MSNMKNTAAEVTKKTVTTEVAKQHEAAATRVATAVEELKQTTEAMTMSNYNLRAVLGKAERLARAEGEFLVWARMSRVLDRAAEQELTWDEINTWLIEAVTDDIINGSLSDGFHSGSSEMDGYRSRGISEAGREALSLLRWGF